MVGLKLFETFKMRNNNNKIIVFIHQGKVLQKSSAFRWFLNVRGGC